MGCDEVGPPHPQFPGLQGGEVAFPGAGRAVATPSGRTWATLGRILRSGRVRGLGRRQDLELNALDRRHLPGPPIIELPLFGRGPYALGQGVGQLVRLIVSVPILWGDAVRVFVLMGRDPTDKDPAKSPADRAFLYLNHKSACLEVGLTLPPALARSASSTTPLQFETASNPTPEDFKGHQDGEKFSAVDGLDRTREGPGRRVRLGVPRPEGTGRPPQVRVLGAHSRGIGVHEILPWEPPLLGLTAVRSTRGRRGAILRARRGEEATLPETPGLPVRGLRLDGQLAAFRALQDIPPGAYPPFVDGGLLGVPAHGAARVDVKTGPGVAVLGPCATREDAGVLPKDSVPPILQRLEGLPERRFLIYATLRPREILSPTR